jgi:hypothetical protein
MRRTLNALSAGLLAGACLLGVVSPAPAKGLPAGNSAVTQYLETVPTAAGGRAGTSVHKQAGSGRASSGLPASVRARFARRGAVGRQTAELAAAARPTGSHRDKRGRTRSVAGGARSSGTTPPTAGSTPLSTLSRALTGGGGADGTSPLLPAILIVIALAGGALAVRRRRST